MTVRTAAFLSCFAVASSGCTLDLGGLGGADGGVSGRDAARGDAGDVVPRGRDAGSPRWDAGDVDADGFDAGRPFDAGSGPGRPDGGRSDAGRRDAGRRDAGRRDAGRRDAGRPDAGPPDAGRADAGPPRVTIRINLDGPRHVGVDYPGVWAADPGRGGACGPNPYENGNPVHGTVDDPLFQGVMWGNPMTCAIGGGSLPSGLYRVRLLFGEVYFGAGCPGGGGNGSRVFDIELEGTRVMRDLDVHARTGGCICSTTGPNGRPFVRTYNVTITDGTLDVSMMASANEGNLSAIEVVSTF